MNFHAKVLAQAFMALNTKSFGEPIMFEYGSIKYELGEFIKYSNLIKYSLPELREIAYLVSTDSAVYKTDYDNALPGLTSVHKRKLTIKLAIRLIEKDLFEVDIGNDKYYKLQKEYDELKAKYDKIKEVIGDV